MTNYFLDDAVKACPHPSLDESSEPDRQFQFSAYQETLSCLLDPSGTTVIHSIPAGAGSGKTRLLIAILNGLQRCGIPHHEIEAISFTNASANDFRRKHIESATDLLNGIGSDPKNISICTIHQSAINVLRKLQPHMGGVGYYFDDARTGGQDDEDEEKRKAVRLALYSSVVYGHGDETLLDILANYAEGEDKAFILEDLGERGHHLEKARRLIHEEMASDAGLGAFTNTAEGGPDYCIAVATDALMRLFNAGRPLEDKRNIFGIPAFMAVDEAQDIDFLQLLYLRALAQNGTSIILVGDSRQTLFEFRNSLSDYPFRDDFMRDFVKGTSIKSSISGHALQTNYRSRKQIVDGAENVSRMIVEYSIKRHQEVQKPQNIEVIQDPPAVKPGIAYTQKNEAEKLSIAVSVIVGEPDKDIVQPVAKVIPGMTGALGLLPEFNKPAKNTEKAESVKRPRPSQIVGLSGGQNKGFICTNLAKLYERASGGETAAIITRNGVRQCDLEYLKGLFVHEYPEAANRLKLNLISPPKHAPLAECWFPGADDGIPVHQLPFSSIMVAGAMAFILSSDRGTKQRLEVAGMRELHHVFVRPEGILEIRQRDDHIKAIAEELKLFFDGLSSKLDELFPEAGEDMLPARMDDLRSIVARFTFDVLVQYGKLLWETRHKPQSYPCRFHQMACEYLKGVEAMVIRPLADTKGYLKLMWRALSSTRFGLTQVERAKLSAAGLKPEYMDAGTCLNNFPQSLNDYCSVRGMSNKDMEKHRELFINDRETIYDEFSQLWHIKTRTYMREIARSLGREVRANPQSAEESYRQVVWHDSYRNACYKSRVVITYKQEKKQYGGLFVDFLKGVKGDAAVARRRNGKIKSQGKDVAIDITTIHSAKGLEWDHVVLYFPQPSPNDKESSFKACRDLIYVAMTRAARTLTIVLQKRKKLVESPTDTGIKVIVELMHQWADINGLYNRQLDWGDVLPHGENGGVTVYDETSHSELERSQTCRMRHYYEDMRSLPTMVPLTPPSYAFFFHGAMSTVCASFIGQRLPARGDVSIDVAAAVSQVLDRSMAEEDAYRFLKTQVGDLLYTLMEGMIPMYFLGDRSRHQALLSFYTNSFAHHLAAIAAKSRLFRILKECRGKPVYRILIEKSVREVLRTCDGQEFLPIVGVPDIKIIGPDLTYLADYKTVPFCKEGRDGEVSDSYERTISTKTQQQVNFYQGMVQAAEGHQYLAEILYVADVTLFEYEDIPHACEALPHIGQGPNFKVVAGVEHAKIVYTDRFDQGQFAETEAQIRELRATYQDSSSRPFDMFQAVPLVGCGLGEVAFDQCRQCGSGIHCSFNKSLLVGAA